MDQPQKAAPYTWEHSKYGLLAAEYNLQDLITKIKAGPFPQPNLTKMNEYLGKYGSFTYAVNSLTINSPL